MNKHDIIDLEERALKAYHRKAQEEGITRNQPSNGSTEVEEVDGTVYVTLGNVNGPLARYKVSESGRLYELEIEESGAES